MTENVAVTGVDEFSVKVQPPVPEQPTTRPARERIPRARGCGERNRRALRKKVRAGAARRRAGVDADRRARDGAQARD